MDSLPLELQIAVFEPLCQEDLLSSALVCHAWRDVAWDTVMWQTCTIRLSGLLGVLFGEDSSREIDNDDFIPLASDSNRFLALAARATRIYLDITLVDSLIKVMLEVACSAPGNILFPALHTLDCGGFGGPQGDLSHSVFAGSPIKILQIYGGHTKEATLVSRRLLLGLLTTHPQVQKVGCREGYAPESAGIPEFWRLPDLRSLKYRGHITYEEWTKLIQECPELAEVALDEYTPYPIPPSPNPPSVSAPSLRQLNLAELWSFDLTINILEYTEAPHLMELDFNVDPDTENGEAEYASANRARSALRSLAQRSQHIESLNLGASIDFGVDIVAAFCSLRKLRVTDWTLGCQLDDNGIESLCRSLPNMREFYLGHVDALQRGRDCPKITPKSLGSFSRHCKQLTYLGLPVTATKPEDFVGSILVQLVAFQENLKHLTLSTLILLRDRTTDFVSFLTVQCPKLTDLEIYELIIPDQYVPLSIVREIRQEMQDTYFRVRAGS